MKRSPSRSAFTLIEMITVITVIAILTGLVLSIAGLVQNKGTRAKAETEIRAFSAACEAYKADNGGYPQDAKPNGLSGVTGTLDPRVDTAPTTAVYKKASLYLYRALSGDYNADGKVNSTDGKFDVAGTSLFPVPDPLVAPKSYIEFKQSSLGGTKINGVVTAVTYLSDPFGNSYGYSTAGLEIEQNFRSKLATDDNAKRDDPKGYNSTFDLWSTGGATGSSDNDKAKWIKNW